MTMVAVAAKLSKQSKPLPAANSDFHEISITRQALLRAKGKLRDAHAVLAKAVKGGRRYSLPLAIAISVSTSAALAAPLPSRPFLTLEAARSVVAAAEAEAKREGWPCVISVVDRDGLPIILERMDDAAVLAGVELAPGKARTAALFRRPSGALEDAINGKRPAAATARGFVLMRGGVPIVVGGQIVGAIGVSADTPDHDELIAKAGIAALAQ